mgnify:CR=1 FL=1
MKSDGGVDYQKTDAKEKNGWAATRKKKKSTEQQCGFAECLDSGIPPYETPIATQSAENEKLVLQWAEEYVRLRENGEELWRFFEKKIKNLRKLEQK